MDITRIMEEQSKKIFFAYAVVDKNGNPYLKTGAISTEREPLEQAVEFMNATANLNGNEHLSPFKVVELAWSDGNGN